MTMEDSTRHRTLETVATEILRLVGSEVVRVGVDGVDGAGKSVFADELAAVLQRRGVTVVRVSVDGFHQPASVRYRRGRTSPDGFFRDSYDYAAFERLVLEPFAPGGTRRYVRAIHDVEAERPVEPVVETATSADVLVVDGIFLHRPELRSHWDYSVFLDVDFAISVPRGAQRGSGHAYPAAESNWRYIEGQRRYFDECRPRERATVVVDNDDLADAHLVARSDGRGDTGPTTADGGVPTRRGER